MTALKIIVITFVNNFLFILFCMYILSVKDDGDLWILIEYKIMRINIQTFIIVINMSENQCIINIINSI